MNRMSVFDADWIKFRPGGTNNEINRNVSQKTEIILTFYDHFCDT